MKVRYFPWYKHIGTQDGVCGDRPTIIGTRIEPKNVVGYGTVEETMEYFSLTREQIEEAFQFMASR